MPEAFSFIFAIRARVLSPSNGEAVHVPRDASPTRLAVIEASPEPYLQLENAHARVPLDLYFYSLEGDARSGLHHMPFRHG